MANLRLWGCSGSLCGIRLLPVSPEFWSTVRHSFWCLNHLPQSISGRLGKAEQRGGEGRGKRVWREALGQAHGCMLHVGRASKKQQVVSGWLSLNCLCRPWTWGKVWSCCKHIHIQLPWFLFRTAFTLPYFWFAKLYRWIVNSFTWYTWKNLK